VRFTKTFRPHACRALASDSVAAPPLALRTVTDNMASPRFEIMGRSGPEDALQVRGLAELVNASALTRLFQASRQPGLQTSPSTSFSRSQAVQLSSNTSAQVTAGADWSIALGSTPSASSTYYKDVAEAQRLSNMVEGTSPEARILRDLASSRFVCTQPSFALQVCQKSVRAHQLKQCTPVYVEQLKCQIKL
jgi:hypothetical protein